MSPRVLRAAAVAALLPLALSGCGAVQAVRKPTAGTARDAAELQQRWSSPATEPTWVPEDATGIRWAAATSGAADVAPAAVRVTTRSPLPPDCTEVARRSTAALTASWVPSHVPARIERCGNWAVVPVEGGWFAWTPFAAAGPDGGRRAAS